MRQTILLYILIFYSFSALGQSGKSSYDFLLLPSSARAAALGGTNVSVIENDISLIYQNPGFLGQEMDLNLNLNYLAYIADIGMGSVTFGKALGERSAWGIGVNYANYGNMKEALEDQSIVGDLTANDMCANLFFSRDLTEKIRGGVAAKFIYSAYDQYTSIGLGVDLGLSYYDKEKGLSLGLVGKNLGGQIQAYDQETGSMPWDIQLGLTKRMSHAPIRFSVTGMHLNQWEFYNVNGEKDSFFATFTKHLVFGVDFIPSENLWIGLGYNVKRGADMKLEQGNKMAGFSIGAGFKVKAFSIGCSVGQYHPSATSFMLSVTTSFAEMKL